MIGDLWTAFGDTLRTGPPAVVLTARSDGAERALADALGDRPVVVPGDLARFCVAAGVAREGARPIVTLGRRLPFVAPDESLIGVTADPAVAALAMGEGWPLVRPSLPADLDTLFEDVPPRVAVLIGEAAAADEIPPGPARWEPRLWRKGGGPTLVVSGVLLDVVLPVARMLAGRGFAPTVIEMPVLTRKAEAVLLERDTFFAGPAELADDVTDGLWPSELERIEVGGRTPRQVMEAVLAAVPSRRA